MGKISDLKQEAAALRLTVDVVVFSIYQQRLSVLVVKRQSAPFANTWMLPSTQVNMASDLHLEAAAKRNIKVLTNGELAYLEQVQTIGNQIRDPRGWSVTVAYYGLISSDEELEPKIASKENLQWLAVDDAMKSPLAFDHQQIIENCLQRFQNKSLYTSLPIFLLPAEFTLTELQKTYETILGFKIEKKSFRRRLLDAGFLEETGNIRRASHRPAQLYRLSKLQPYYFARIIEGVRESKNISS